MLEKRRTGTRIALALAGALATTTIAGGARADTPPPSALSKVNDVLGAIANAYGSFQAAQFVLTLFGVGAGPSIQDAINQLESFMQNYRDLALVNNVTSDMRQFSLISSDYMNGLTDNLEADFISRSINDFSQLQGDIQAGNMADAYTLGPAFNLLGMTFVAGMKAFGVQNPANAFPQSQLDYYLEQMVNTDYSLVGGINVNMDVSCSVVAPMSSGASGSDLFQWTQAGKKMWPKYDAAWSTPPAFPSQQITCDFNRACNTLSNELSCCTYFYGGGFGGGSYSAAVTGANREAALTKLNADRRAFLADPSVMTVRTGMLGAVAALPAGESVITDSVPSASCQGHVGF